MKKILTVYLKPYYYRMMVGFLIKFTGTLMDLGLPWILAYMIDTVIPLGERRMVYVWGGVMVICSLLAVTLNVLANRMASRVSSDVMEVIRGDLFAKVMYLSDSQADAYTKPSLISRLTSDTYHVHQMLGRMQRLGVRAPILLIGGLIVTMTLDPVLAFILFCTLPVLCFVTIAVTKKSIPMFASLQQSVDRFVRLVREDIAGIRVIKALSKEDSERERFDRGNRDVVEKETKAQITTAVINPVMNVLLNLGLVCVIMAGAWRVNEGTSQVGKILAFMTYFTIILNAMMSISRMFVIMSKAVASADRIALILDEKNPLGVYKETEAEAEKIKNDKKPNKSNEKSVPYIRFKHVCFSYNKKENNLEDIDFSLNKGETLGIIGATGSGKSTVVSLLMRFYDPDQGSVLIDGKDIRTMELDAHRRRFGTVFQNDTIFEDTIFENISLGRNFTREQVMEAVFYARASEFVVEKSGGLYEKLDIRGANLSGGQKQRILISRALAGKPDILILDDSSSALDYKTDADLRRELKEHFQDTTCIIIAQRISTIMSADHIMVLEDGRVVGYGTHEQLINTCEIYSEISGSQMGE